MGKHGGVNKRGVLLRGRTLLKVVEGIGSIYLEPITDSGRCHGCSEITNNVAMTIHAKVFHCGDKGCNGKVEGEVIKKHRENLSWQAFAQMQS